MPPHIICTPRWSIASGPLVRVVELGELGRTGDVVEEIERREDRTGVGTVVSCIASHEVHERWGGGGARSFGFVPFGIARGGKLKTL